jgi:2-isopropylmalate synthase
MRVKILDTTLRDAPLAAGARLGFDDCLRLLRALDALGAEVIECGREFHGRAAGVALEHARLALACRPGEPHPSGTVSLFAAAGEDMRAEVARLKALGCEVLLNFEHFFDACETSPEAALAALDAGAGAVILCDTRGATLPSRAAAICREARGRTGAPLGIRAMNDSDAAVANTLAAIENGCTWAAGAINGYGERAGTANLCSVLPALELKLNRGAAGPGRLNLLRPTARLAAEAVGLRLPPSAPYVGDAAFGPAQPTMRAVLSAPGAAPHIDPLAVGFEIPMGEYQDRLRGLAAEGYDLEIADGTLELLSREANRPDFRPFEVVEWEVGARQRGLRDSQTRASVVVDVRGSILSASAEGEGPVHALDLALRQCLSTVYPALDNARLADYRLRVLRPEQGSAARARVLIDWTGPEGQWTTEGVSGNILDASFRALADGIRLELHRLAEKNRDVAGAVEDRSWAV